MRWHGGLPALSCAWLVSNIVLMAVEPSWFTLFMIAWWLVAVGLVVADARTAR